ncbi:potassium channel family protein [Streptomyces sp. NPDC051310]|uniref:potassium channel family protein n=1 Tax=Streptomyces sp. NPDC051310 TaxID=3365649 RepID=UPI0037A102E7
MRGLRLAAPALVTAAVAGYFVLPIDGLGPRRPVLSWTLFVVALGLIAVLLLRQIRAVLTDRPHTRPGLVIPVLMCLSVLVFAGGYLALARHPGEFSGLRTRVDALYFTVVTLATVGYGDITPRGQTARVVVMLQIVYSFVFLTAAATALSRRLRALVVTRRGRGEGP